MVRREWSSASVEMPCFSKTVNEVQSIEVASSLIQDGQRFVENACASVP